MSRPVTLLVDDDDDDDSGSLIPSLSPILPLLPCSLKPLSVYTGLHITPHQPLAKRSRIGKGRGGGQGISALTIVEGTVFICRKENIKKINKDQSQEAGCGVLGPAKAGPAGQFGALLTNQVIGFQDGEAWVREAEGLAVNSWHWSQNESAARTPA